MKGEGRREKGEEDLSWSIVDPGRSVQGSEFREEDD